ncbi:BTAD domain-containing putative transcriptional regulator [Streptomyces sp. NBC_01431]|uniref:BTAD domain-containing putative transcriptional regulator n=1 Tax=Streptomyces sp. NBC_01431 TaxID=2903863 RepID=UPI002E305C24|nr:BTAD domain-containing putative transcriptional regulator [Streptomyces sp. NBC_01431]
MRYFLLGPLRIEGPEAVPAGARLRSLLAFLLLNAGRTVPAGRLVDALYGDEPPVGATNALQSQVSRLRRTLAIEHGPAGYRLAADPDDVDVLRFERLARDGARAREAGDAGRAAVLLREALGLWRGPALVDVADAPFAAAQSARLEELRAAAVEERAEAELALGTDPAELLGWLREAVAAHPLRERLRGQLMRALRRAGRPAEALAEYERARELLAGELGTDPSPELAAVHLSILRGEQSPPPPSSRLPAQLTSFVGRDDELTALIALLGASRLVTLIGTGGAGKTRLALEAAARLPGEVCFVDLTSATGAVSAVRTALGLRDTGPLAGTGTGTGTGTRTGTGTGTGTETDADTHTPTHTRTGPSGGDAEAALVTALQDRNLLLVLDNCEQIIEEAALLAHRLLSRCPGLRILATSREALGITGESLRPLGSLATASAVRLFTDRATAVQPGFTPDGPNSPLLQRICTDLDGLPLAIELAAARLRQLPLSEIASRLDDRFGLLSRGDRTKPARHRTLRAVVEWSWSLLSDREREFAAQLTVFAGGATAEAAALVCGAGPDADDLLASLCDKSLVEAGQGRYRMLETIRAYAAKQLPFLERELTARAHTAHFLDLAEMADPELRSSGQLRWLERLSAEHANLRAALVRSVGVAGSADGADHPRALRLIAALSSFWWLRGLRGDVAPVAADMLRALDGRVPEGFEEEYVLCVLAAGAGGAASGADLARAGRIVAQRDRAFRQPFTAFLWAISAGPSAAAERPELTGDDPWSQALARAGAGHLHLFHSRVEEASRDLSAALSAFRELGERWGTATTLTGLAAVLAAQGDRETALARTGEALALFREIGVWEDIADLHVQRAELLEAMGDLAGGQQEREWARTAARRAGVIR